MVVAGGCSGLEMVAVATMGGHGVESDRREMMFEFWVVFFFDLSTCLGEILSSKSDLLLSMVRFKSW